MRALVTGATGFLGSRIARALVNRGAEVRALVRPTSDRRRINDLPLEFAVGDVTDQASIARALDGIDVCYHAAALYEFGTPDPAKMEAINVGGTRNILEECTNHDIGCVYVSSTIALGPTSPKPADETHRSVDHPRSTYEATKREARDVAESMAKGGARVRIGIPATIYGPDDPSLGGLLHRLFAKGIMKVGFLPNMMMSLVHVDDCADGLIRIAESGRDGEQYILSQQALTFRQWFEALARASGRAAPKVYLSERAVARLRPVAAVLAPAIGLSRSLANEAIANSQGIHWSFSGEKARAELGWSPRALDEGLAETMAWYRKESSRARHRVP
jgi:dihydroflavonol-4-reductase